MRILSRSFITLLLIHQIIFLPLADTSSAQTLSADSLIGQARKSYFEGDFDQAIALIKTCLQETTPDSLGLQEAYKILAQAYLAKNYNSAAKEVVVKLLAVNPHYGPTIEQEPPSFVKLVEQVKMEQKPAQTQGSSGDTKWFWIGAGGALVVGAATFIIFSNNNDGGGNNQLKGPPEMPKTPQ
jgi:hypothetical protein